MIRNPRKTLADHLATQPEILFAMLYGSAIESTHFRDLDVGILLDRSLVPPDREWAYAFALADQLTAGTGCPVDVRVLNSAPLPFRYNVSRGEPLVVNDGRAFTAFLARTWSEFFDFRPFALQYLRELT